MKSYITLHIKHHNTADAEVLVAVLADVGFYGFEELPNLLNASINAELYNEHEVKSLLSSFDYSVELVHQENWNQQWEQSFDSVLIPHQHCEGFFAHIRAGFHHPESRASHEVIITPKMSFGTGHHGTTYLMVQAMEALDFHEKSVLDFGTGTGVLAVLAEQLGAEKVLAIDNDNWSINNAAENIEVNHCTKIELLQKDNLDGLESADIVLANINLNVIEQYLTDIFSITKNGGEVLFSGLLTSDKEKIIEKIIATGFEIIEINNREGWMMIRAAKK